VGYLLAGRCTFPPPPAALLFRRLHKSVAEFNRWLLANTVEVGKWARANTKRLKGKEIL